MTMLAVSPPHAVEAPRSSGYAANIAHVRRLVASADVQRSFARKMDDLVAKSAHNLARYGLNVRLQAETLVVPTPIVADVVNVATRPAAEVAAAIAAIDTRPLSLDEAMAEFGFADAGPISGSWQSEERRLPRLA